MSMAIHRQVEELTKHFSSIKQSLESNKPPKQGDIDACVRVISELGGSLNGVSSSASELLKVMQSKFKELFDSEQSLGKHRLNNLQKKVLELQKLVKKLKEKIEKQDKTIKDLKHKITKVEAEYETLKEDNQILVLCQTAFAAENIIVNTVLPNNLSRRYPIRRTEDMEEELKGSGFDRRVFASKKSKEKAKLEWEKLQTQLKWNKKWSIKSLRAVKRHRRSPAHPTKPPREVRRVFRELKKTKKDHIFQQDRGHFEWCLETYEKLVPNAKKLA